MDEMLYQTIVDESRETYQNSCRKMEEVLVGCNGEDYINLEAIIRDTAHRHNAYLDDEAIMDVYWIVKGC